MPELAVVADFFSALAILAVLAWSYGFVLRTFGHLTMARAFIGAMFGSVALLQMLTPLEVAPGVIVDMRHVPVLLAAGYLGWTGALPCLVIAIAARVYAGGIGMEGGVIGLILTTLVGLGWYEIMHNRPRRGLLALTALFLVGVIRLTGLFFIPSQIAVHMLVNVFPTLLALEFVACVMIGILLERELVRTRSPFLSMDGSIMDPASGLYSPEGLEQEYENAVSDQSAKASVGLTLIQIKHPSWLVRTFGVEALDKARSTLRRRANLALNRGALIGLTRRGEIAIVSFDLDARTHLAHVDALRRSVAAERIRLPDGAEVRVSVEMSQAWGPVTRPLFQHIQDARIRAADDRAAQSAKSAHNPDTIGLRDALFGSIHKL